MAGKSQLSMGKNIILKYFAALVFLINPITKGSAQNISRLTLKENKKC